MLEQIKYGNPENDGPINEIFKNVKTDFEYACRNGFVAGFGNYVLKRLINVNKSRRAHGFSEFDARQVNDFIFRKAA